MLIIEDQRYSLHRISAISTTPGHPEYQEVYISELSGLLQNVMIFKSLCEKYNIKEGETISACDGIDAIRMAMDRYTSFSTR